MKAVHEYKKYKELLLDLKKKYGVPSGSYFLNNISYSPRSSIKRSKEGLFVHHDKEDTAIMLSCPEQNKKHNYPFGWHNPEYLTYCNILEHLMLHVLISTREEGVINKELQQETGSGGIVAFMAPQINTYLAGAYSYKAAWLVTALSIFDNPKNVESYYLCLEYMIKNYKGIMFSDRITLAAALTSPDRMVAYDKEKMASYSINLFNRLKHC